MIFFATRTKARAFKSANGKFVDLGADAPAGKRWAFKLNKVA